MAQDRLRLLAHVYDSVASIHMTENPGRHPGESSVLGYFALLISSVVARQLSGPRFHVTSV